MKMATPETLKKEILSASLDERLKKAYVTEENVKEQYDRYINLLNEFEALFGKDRDVRLFSAPGRTEVGGNHTDHNHGRVLAAGINLDAIAAASKNDENIVRVKSEGYSMDVVDATDLSVNPNEMGHSPALVRGVLAGFKKYGYKIGGFDATTASRVIAGSGLSSSAAYEVLVGTMVNYLYNDGKVDAVTIAKIAQYAENEYFGKPSGLMDQMACAVGGLIYIDFFDKANPVIKQVPVDFEAHQYSLCIVDTKGSHADLTDDYAAIPVEMKQVANYFGEELLSRVSEEDFISKVGEMRASGKVNDRAVLRALHFYTEQDRVAEGVAALENQEFDHFLDVIKRSGDSSFKLLQNIYSAKDPLTQNVSIALGFSEKFIGKNGVCRVHGGGFAGTIQAFVKNAAVAEYKKNIESIFGEGACHVLKVRPYGGIKVVE